MEHEIDPVIGYQEIITGIAPGLIACLIIFFPFYLSSGEFIYLDWNGIGNSHWQFEHIGSTTGWSWIGFTWIPKILVQLPFIALFGKNASAIFSKTLIAVLFMTGSLGMRMIFRKKNLEFLLGTAILCFSPFVYERIMMGQLTMVSAVLTAPIMAYFADSMLRRKSSSSVIAAAVVFTLSCMLQPHAMVVHSMIVGAIAVAHLVGNRTDATKIMEIAKTTIKFGLMSILLNSYWIIPFFILPQPPQVSEINNRENKFFQPSEKGITGFFANAGQFNSWRENKMKVSYKDLPLPIFFFAVGLMIAIAAMGSMDGNNQLAKAMAICLAIGLILAPGIESPIMKMAYDKMPFANAFRDSNKFVELITLAYAVLIPMGMRAIAGQNRLIFAIAILAIIAYNYPAIGLADQLRPNTVPDEYSQIGYLLNETALYMPQGIYITYNWSLRSGLDGRVLNPLIWMYPHVVVPQGPYDYSRFNPGPNGCAGIECINSTEYDLIIWDMCGARDMLNNNPGFERGQEKGCLRVYRRKKSYEHESDISAPITYM